jgi:hypothetical protein
VRKHAWGRHHILDYATDSCDAAHTAAPPHSGAGMIVFARAARRAAACALVLVSSSCITLHRPPFMEASSVRDWPPVLEAARRQADEGKFGSADTTLMNFAIRYPSSNEALETMYWRALFKLDPSNRASSFSSAIASLDTYLAAEKPRKHIDEARTLRRVAGQMDGLNKLAANALAQVKDTTTAAPGIPKAPGIETKPAAPDVTAANTAAEVEIKRLKDELAKANAELERIRRRLAQPPPTKP